MNPWRTTSSRVVYENAWMTVREDQVIRPDGLPGIYGVVELAPSVGVLALDDAGRVALVRQWRYVHGRVGLEIPTGAIDSSDDSDAAAAARELREETGLTAGRWTRIGQIENSNGATTDVATIFVAQDLHLDVEFVGDPREPTALEWCDLRLAIDLVLSGEIRESTSVAALLLAERSLRATLE